MSVTDFTNLINVDVVSGLFQCFDSRCLQMDQKERVISEFEMDFKKSRLSSSLYSTYTRSLEPGGSRPPKIPGNTTHNPRGTYQVSKRNTLSYIRKTHSNFAVATTYRPMEQPWEQR